MEPAGHWAAAADSRVMIANAPPFPDYYNSRSVLSLSITHVVVATLHIIFGIACIFAVPHWTSLVAFPIWGGVVFCVAGGLGIGSYKNHSKGVIGTFLGFSCFSILIAAIMIVFYVFPFVYFDDTRYTYRYGQYGWGYYSLYSKTVKDTGKGLTAAVYILILSELGISIASTIYASQAFCECCRLCVECEQRYCRGCNDCECDCNGTSGYDQYSQSYVVPQQSLQQPHIQQHRGPVVQQRAFPPSSRVSGGYVRFGNQPFATNPTSLVNIYINIPGQIPMPVTSTGSGGTQVIIQDQRTPQETEAQQQTQTAQALPQHTEQQGLSTAPPGYNSAYGYEM